MRWNTILVGMACLSSSALTARADFAWSDTFNAGASPLWRNEQGNWSAASGRYDAANWGNYPNARSSVPFKLAQTDVSVDFVNLQDGGLWVRSAESATGPVGRSGILLVTGGQTLTGTTLYWHVVPPGGNYGAQLAPSTPFISSGVTDATIRVTAIGDTFAAYINGSTTPATTLTMPGYSVGEVALYDYSPNQSVDAVRIRSSTVTPGDANVDGKVNFDDLLTLAKNYGVSSGAEWIRGDFTGDAAVNFNDLLLLAKNYGVGGAASDRTPADASRTFVADWSLAQDLVPEPATVSAILAAAITSLASARRRRPSPAASG